MLQILHRSNSLGNLTRMPYINDNYIAYKTIPVYRLYSLISRTSIQLNISFLFFSLSLCELRNHDNLYIPERSFFGKAYALVSTLPSVDLIGPLSHVITAHFHNLESSVPVAILMGFVDFE